MNDPEINKEQVMEFQCIPDGAHFRELGKKPRTFVKIRCHYGSGVPFQVYRTHLGENDQPVPINWHDSFNAVDYQGCLAKCPPWVEFEVIPTP
jgi:hypothetical protein